MMMVSDNTATNVVIDAVGMDAVNARMRSLGAKALALRRRMMDTEAARRGDENVASPADLVRVLQALERGDGLSAEARAIALDVMTRPMTSPLRAGIPAGVRVASKPGVARRRRGRSRFRAARGPAVRARGDDDAFWLRARRASEPSPTSPARHSPTTNVWRAPAPKAACSTAPDGLASERSANRGPRAMTACSPRNTCSFFAW